jgi:2-oxoglutarate dehydrogenase E2 component (dihydrolipoamide succinyltransferase)
MRVDVRLIQFGMAMQEGSVLAWLAEIGDAVVEGEPLVEIETEKATAEVPAPASGTLESIVAEPGALIPVRGLLGTIAVV